MHLGTALSYSTTNSVPQTKRGRICGLYRYAA